MEDALRVFNTMESGNGCISQRALIKIAAATFFLFPVLLQLNADVSRYASDVTCRVRIAWLEFFKRIFRELRRGSLFKYTIFSVAIV